MDFQNASKLTEDQARDYLEKLRWDGQPFCPHCGSLSVGKLHGKATRPGVYKCKDSACRKQFTVTVGTIFEDSHIPLGKWVMAFCLVCSSKKGISALQLQRMLDLKSYKSAWHMGHRIRHAMQNEPMRTILSGIVEMDETYVGGKPPKFPKIKRKAGRGTTKVPVAALVERGGSLRAKVVGKVTAPRLKDAIYEAVDIEKTRLMTDDFPTYRRSIAKMFPGRHESVRHNKGEYSRGDVHVNTAESFFALLKRGVHGTFHSVSKQHLQRYCDEFAFRWNHRKTTDGERTEAALKLAPGCRLVYRSKAS